MNNQGSKSLKSLIKKSSNKQIDSKQTDKKNNKSKKETSEESSSSESPDYTSSTLIKLNELIYPCKDEILYTRVILYPHQMNHDLYINLKKNLVDKIEGKCIKDGYIIKVYKILEYVNGVIEPENFTGTAVYDVKYFAKICSVLKESIIVTKISSYVPNANFALSDFGPIIKIIFTKNERDINSKVFTIGNDKNIIHIPTQTKLEVDTYVKIQIKSIKFYLNDTIIKCMGYLDNIATVDEIDKYAFKDEFMKLTKNGDTQNSIYFNDDNEIEEKNIDKSFTTHLQASNINDI